MRLELESAILYQSIDCKVPLSFINGYHIQEEMLYEDQRSGRIVRNDKGQYPIL